MIRSGAHTHRDTVVARLLGDKALRGQNEAGATAASLFPEVASTEKTRPGTFIGRSNASASEDIHRSGLCECYIAHVVSPIEDLTICVNSIKLQSFVQIRPLALDRRRPVPREMLVCLSYVSQYASLGDTGRYKRACPDP